MELFKSLLIVIMICLSVISCNKNVVNKDVINTDNVEITGIIQKQEFTTYQYGTHTISGSALYALRSTSVSLDDYINQNVTVIGHKIDGYPVDGGPDYIEVEAIANKTK